MSGSDIPDLSPEATPRRLIMLVGVDGSESSLRARAYAVGLARRSHAYLIMVYVRQLSTMTAFAPAREPPPSRRPRTRWPPSSAGR